MAGVTTATLSLPIKKDGSTEGDDENDRVPVWSSSSSKTPNPFGWRLPTLRIDHAWKPSLK